jgi:hypothetical protein
MRELVGDSMSTNGSTSPAHCAVAIVHSSRTSPQPALLWASAVNAGPERRDGVVVSPFEFEIVSGDKRPSRSLAVATALA